MRVTFNFENKEGFLPPIVHTNTLNNELEVDFACVRTFISHLMRSSEKQKSKK